MDNFTPITNCRVCGHIFFKEPLLRYTNMPKAAQFLPDARSLESDHGVDLEVFQCSGCGLVQLSNHPVPYYREVIRASSVSEEMKDFRKKQFSNFVKKHHLSFKKIIEIGCGAGEFLSLMQPFASETYGLEQSKVSVDQCVKKGLKVFSGFIDNADYRLNHAPFDAFFILNFLEHLPEPNSTLRGIYNNLSDEGIGLIEVPNFDMILQKKLFSEFIVDHLFYFTKETLSSTLWLNGFKIIDCKEEWHDYIISAVVQKRKKIDLSDFSKYQKQLKHEIEGYLRLFNDKKVAIWGASHQALSIISLLKLTDKIIYVVDSAVFKQGKFTSATHIPIVSPDKLYSDPADAIIIMAAGYSDEVARIIRQNFDKNISIAIVRNFGLEVVKT